MNKEMMFFGDHKLDFKNTNIDDLEYYAISELNKIPVPAKIIDILEDHLIENHLGEGLSRLLSIDKWFSVTFPSIPDTPDYLSILLNTKDHVNTVGPLCMHIYITPEHIELPVIFYLPYAWYSQENIEKIKVIRSYYNSIIKRFGGTHALYTFEHYWQKYYDYDNFVNGSVLLGFEETLKTKFGEKKKSLFSCKQGKFPKYYIDTFSDISA
ncbi:MAG: hypothetical protein FWB86_14000 [Treponema sp.]|nr:hypothetical protein [Treponema sp.]